MHAQTVQQPLTRCHAPDTRAARSPEQAEPEWTRAYEAALTQCSHGAECKQVSAWVAGPTAGPHLGTTLGALCAAAGQHGRLVGRMRAVTRHSCTGRFSQGPPAMHTPTNVLPAAWAFMSGAADHASLCSHACPVLMITRAQGPSCTIGKRITPVTVLSGSIVRIWGTLELVGHVQGVLCSRWCSSRSS